MTGELFEIEEGLSPRLRWIQRHGIATAVTRDGIATALTRDGHWQAWIPEDNPWAVMLAGCGETEDDALVALARRLGLRTWQEEEFYGTGV